MTITTVALPSTMSSKGPPPPRAYKSHHVRFRIVVADDHELIREGLVSILSSERDFTVCAVAVDEKAASELVARYQPDLLLLDLFLGDRDGLHLVKELGCRFPRMRILTLMSHENAEYAERLFGAGAAGYLVTSARDCELIEAVRTIAAGGTYPQSHGVGLNSRQQKGRQGETVAALTDRELRVFHLIGLRHGTGRIAELLGLSRKTIETYREHIKNKLGFADGAALKQGALGWVEAARTKGVRIAAKGRNFPQRSGRTPDVRPLSLR